MYAAVDNAVTLAGYTRVDAAAFYNFRRDTRVQINVDNMLDTKFFLTADNNNNITPGAPGTVRLTLTTGF